jgi:hypothetical protein
MPSLIVRTTHKVQSMLLYTRAACVHACNTLSCNPVLRSTSNCKAAIDIASNHDQR